MKFKTKDLVMGALLLALGVLLPSIFHLAGINGSLFSPMHIPVLLAGFILGPSLGLIIGILTPILSSLFTGMPQAPFLWVMVVELALYGFAAGIFYKKMKLHIVISLIAAMIVGRLGGALGAYTLANLFALKINAMAFLKGATILAWPAITLHLILIPVLMRVYNLNFQRQ